MLTCIFPFLREYLAKNVSVTVYPVNEPWLYSILWCSGVPSVSSDAPQVLRKVPYPIWLMVNNSPLSVCHLTGDTHTHTHTHSTDKVTQCGERTAGERTETDDGSARLKGKDRQKYEGSQQQVLAQCGFREQQDPGKESGTNGDKGTDQK